MFMEASMPGAVCGRELPQLGQRRAYRLEPAHRCVDRRIGRIKPAQVAATWTQNAPSIFQLVMLSEHTHRGKAVII